MFIQSTHHNPYHPHEPMTAVPEPSTALLILLALAAYGLFLWLKKGGK